MSIASRGLGDVTIHQSPERLHGLDGLRGVLALYVALYHLAAPLTRSGSALEPLAAWLHPAWYSVDVFFVMSGFVMAHVYGQWLERRAIGPAWRQFMRARVARLYPVHLAVLAAFFLWLVPHIHGSDEFHSSAGRFSWQSFLASIAMLHGPWVNHRTWNYPAWSVSAEWHAYVLFPLVAPYLLRLNRMAAVLALATALAVPAVLYAIRLGDIERFPTNGWVLFLRVLPLFMAGVLLYRFRRAGRFDRPALALAVVGTTLVALALPLLAPLAVALIPAVVLCVLANKTLAHELSRPVLQLLGACSYSLYMTHALVEMIWVNGLIRAAERWLGWQVTVDLWGSLVVLASAVALAAVLAWITWRFVEVPARRALTRTPRLEPEQALPRASAR